ASRGVGQESICVTEQVEQAAGIAFEADSRDRGGHHFGAARFKRIEHDLLVRKARSSGDQPRGEGGASNDKWVGHQTILQQKLSHPETGARFRYCPPPQVTLFATRRA